MSAQPQGLRVSAGRLAALVALLCAMLVLVSLVSACGTEADASGPFSNRGQALNIVVATQPVYGRANCTEPNGAKVNAGDTVVDLGTVGTNCEQVVYLQNGDYSGIGYLPVYGMRRAAGGVRCRADVACNLRGGPGTNFPVIGTIGPGAAAKGYWTSHTGAIIADGGNYNWWEVVDPASGARADIYGPDCQVF